MATITVSILTSLTLSVTRASCAAASLEKDTKKTEAANRHINTRGSDLNFIMIIVSSY